MVFQVANRNNTLLPVIVRFLTSDSVQESQVVNMIQGATNEELVSSFTFLSFWFSSTRKSTDILSEKRQTAFYLISLIALKVPPVNLSVGVTEFGWRISQPDSRLHELYEPMIQRLRRIREYFKYFWIENLVLGHPAVFDLESMTWRMDGQLMELEADVMYQNALKRHFFRMILDRAPISQIRRHFSCRNAVLILSEAVLELLERLMNSRKATHEQLIYSFSNLFLYIQEFSRNNELDGQMIIDFLLSLPYTSPFCLLAISNHVPQSSHLFKLMIPEELTSKVSDDEAARIARGLFMMADVTMDSKLSQVVKAVPDIMVNYFLPGSVCRETQGTGDEDIIIDSHINGTLAQRWKRLLEQGMRREMPSYVIAGLSSQIIWSCQNVITEHLDGLLGQGKMTGIACSFFKRVFSMCSPMHSHGGLGRFFDVSKLAMPSRHLLLKEMMLWVINHLLHLTTHENTQISLIRFCTKAVSFDRDFLILSRLLVAKILTAFPARLSNSLIDDIKSCKDLFILLQYEEGTHKATRINIGKELSMLTEFRNDALFKRLPFSFSDGELGTTITGISPGRYDVSGISNEMWILLQGLFRHDHQSSLRVFADRDVSNQFLVMRIIAQSHLMSNPVFAKELTSKFISLFTENSGRSVLSSIHRDILKQLPLNGDVFLLPFAQFFMGRLLALDYDSLACEVLHAISSLLTGDPLVLHWITRFLRRYYTHLSLNFKQLLRQIVLKVKDADRFFVSPDNIKGMIILMQPHKTFLHPEPDIIVSEYSSAFFHIVDFSVSSLLLSELGLDDIVGELERLVFDVEELWRKRDAVYSALAKLAAELTPEIGYRFFRRLMQHSISVSAVATARQFLVFSMIDVFLKICRETKEIIHGDQTILEAYMNVVMPSFPRLYGCDQEATEFICGIIASVSRDTPKYQQEAVIDAVITVYRYLKLTKYRVHIIRAMNASENHFPPELRSVLATSLDVE